MSHEDQEEPNFVFFEIFVSFVARS